MNQSDSPWPSRLGWCAVLLLGAAIVTSGFELPPQNIGKAATEVVPKAEPSSSPRDLAKLAASEASSETDFNKLTTDQLERRIEALEKLLLEQRAAEFPETSDSALPSTSSIPVDGSRLPELPVGESTRRLSDEESTRDIEIAREANERAEKLVADMREQVKQLEAERARQMKDTLDAARK